MEEIKESIASLLVKYSRDGVLTDQEWRRLEDFWFWVTPLELRIRLSSKQYIAEAIESLNNIPKKQIWDGITNDLDQMDAAVRYFSTN